MQEHDILKQSPKTLLELHAKIVEELRRRDILQSENTPAGDLAEYLFCKALGWQRAAKVQKGYDATDSKGKRYQIKGRRITPSNPLQQ